MVCLWFTTSNQTASWRNDKDFYFGTRYFINTNSSFSLVLRFFNFIRNLPKHGPNIYSCFLHTCKSIQIFYLKPTDVGQRHQTRTMSRGALPEWMQRLPRRTLGCPSWPLNLAEVKTWSPESFWRSCKHWHAPLWMRKRPSYWHSYFKTWIAN